MIKIRDTNMKRKEFKDGTVVTREEVYVTNTSSPSKKDVLEDKAHILDLC